MEAINPECVACGAEADTALCVGSDGISCCTECKEDETFAKWLEKEMEPVMIGRGYGIVGKNEKGENLWGKP